MEKNIKTFKFEIDFSDKIYDGYPWCTLSGDVPVSVYGKPGENFGEDVRKTVKKSKSPSFETYI